MYDEDMETLKAVKKYSARKKRSFNAQINNRDLTEEEMDELFLSS